LYDLLPPTTEFPEDALPLPPAGRPLGAARAPPNAGSPVPPSPAPPTRLLFIPLALRGLTLRNRVVKAATFEAGCSAAGAPQASLIAHHREVAAGGTALTVVAYAAVSPDGKSFGTQLQMAEPARAGLTALSAAVHAEGGAAAVQLTHAGSFAKPELGGCAGAPLGPSRILNPAGEPALRYKSL
jgi:2,4-dienoyl-CoA reductase-like NADH-dependent reductase (Old Yellow Enzyme family)